MLVMPGAALNGMSRANAIPMQANGTTPTTVSPIMRVYSGSEIEKWPMVTPSSVSMLTMMMPKAIAEQHLASR